MAKQIDKVFTELTVGRPVVIITNAHAPAFPEGTIGTISRSQPARNAYTVTVGTSKLIDLRADDVSLDLAGLIARPAEANITISNANDYDGETYNLKRPLSINGIDGDGEVVISLGSALPGDDLGRIFIEATPTGYQIAIYRPNDQGGNAVVTVNASREAHMVDVDADGGSPLGLDLKTRTGTFRAARDG